MLVADLQFGSHLDLIEHALGSLLPTMRAVVLDDKTFSQVAIERFGGRRQTWVEQNETCGTDRKGKRLAFVDKVAPQSGRHRQIIADEFKAGLARLIQVHAPYVSTGGDRPREASPPVSEDETALIALVADEPVRAVNPDYLDEHGRMLAYDKLAGVIRAKAFGDEQMAA
jgi:hypothetical protein